MTVADDIAYFRSLLSEATEAIGRDYFLLPVANADGGDPIVQYRERVYAYELYHQLRVRWPRDWAYSLAGEVDKRGHPLIRNILNNAKPDLLVHIPGRMDANLAAIEIKPLRPDGYPGEDEAFQWDIKKLLAFRDFGYSASFFIAFGESLNRVREYGRILAESGVPVDQVELIHHRDAGISAITVEW